MTAITAELIGGYRVDITNGTHTWRADEPVDVGGDDTGPDPYALLLGSLAACTVITLSMYARRMGIEMTSLSVEYSHDRIHGDDCDHCDEKPAGMIDRVTSRIFIDGDFDDDARQQLMRVAGRCPVHKTLEARGGVRRDGVRRLSRAPSPRPRPQLPARRTHCDVAGALSTTWATRAPWC